MKKIIFVVLGILVLVFLWWTVSPLFINKTVDDATPVVDLDQTDSAGPFFIKDTAAHPATGEVLIIRDGDDTTVRFENYDGTNGPDLYVYLAKDLDAKEFVSLGRAKGNKGNINYQVPSNIDASEYKYVMTWCQAFGVLFDYAEIN